MKKVRWFFGTGFVGFVVSAFNYFQNGSKTIQWTWWAEEDPFHYVYFSDVFVILMIVFFEITIIPTLFWNNWKVR